ncbi:MAG: TetR/AcrR family transcriptional regulator [Saprospiraceae bacterium]|nr:TetR/AcrR family transcriptional regulator [Saprospiraceae bacterium]
MSPRTQDQIDAIRRQSIEAIMEAALELFARQGFHNTSISQIAKEAGISKGLIYNYFDSKDELLKTIVTSAMDTGDQILHKTLDEGQDPMENLGDLIDQIFALIRTNPRYWKLMMSLSMQEDIMIRLKDEIDKQQIKNLGKIIDLLSKAKVENPENEAMLIAAVADGILLHFIHMGDKYPLDTMKKYVKSRFRLHSTNP